MEELNYILKQAKRFHYTNWDDSELKKCIDMLMDLTRQELITLYTSRWISHNKTLKEDWANAKAIFVLSSSVFSIYLRLSSWRASETIPPFLSSNSSINLSVSISFILSLSLPILSEKRSLNISSFRVLL